MANRVDQTINAFRSAAQFAGALADEAYAIFNPSRASQRRFSRRAFNSSNTGFEGADKTRFRKSTTKNPGGNQLMAAANMPLRAQARHLERNHDLARGVINTLVKNVVGPKGIQVEPQPVDTNGEYHEEFALQLLNLWRDWCQCPEVTGQMGWAQVQHLMARSWFRDGEAFAQRIIGRVPGLDHGTAVPLSLELFEADYCPLELNEPSKRILQGIGVNQWNRPTHYYLHKVHPSDISAGGETGALTASVSDMRRLDARHVQHLKLIDRIGQLRGNSVLASVINRMSDLKEFEDAERVAAKIGAKLSVVMTRDPDAAEGGFYSTLLQQNDDGKEEYQRNEMQMEDGMVFYGLLPGENISMIDNKRPNENTGAFRSDQVKMVAAGCDVSHSTIARDYSGTYAAQRQELVETWPSYQLLTTHFTAQFVQPVWRAFVDMALTAGLIQVPANLDVSSLDDALYIGPSMPWIDVLKEAKASTEVLGRTKSLTETLRERGSSAVEFFRNMQRDQKLAQKYGVSLGFESLYKADPEETGAEDDDTKEKNEGGRQNAA